MNYENIFQDFCVVSSQFDNLTILKINIKDRLHFYFYKIITLKINIYGSIQIITSDYSVSDEHNNIPKKFDNCVKFIT
jgi:hypothetical protein